MLLLSGYEITLASRLLELDYVEASVLRPQAPAGPPQAHFLTLKSFQMGVSSIPTLDL
jgi:hypothetical protein